jgi:diphthine synthase
MSLEFIGLGLENEKSLTLESLESLRNSDKIYLETYTSKWHGSTENLEKIIGRKIHPLKRSDLEEDSDKILKEVSNKDVSILILGDPLVATTHISILLEAKKRGIRTRVIHNASIYSVIGETGLHLYKFGATITIPFPEKTKNQSPKSIFETICKNQKAGYHTLCLFDLISEKEKYMSPQQGMEILIKSEHVSDENELVVFGRAGTEEPLIVYGKIKDLIGMDFGEPPFVLIIPGNLHFTEGEYLDYYRVD